jgi:hypothetical protein
MRAHHVGWRRAPVLALAASLLTVLTATAASATTQPSSHAAARTAAPATQVINATLTINCAHLTSSAATYAVAHGYCRPAGKSFIPNGVVPGNCGSSVLWMSNARGGNARFLYGFESTAGNIVYRSLDITWVNWSRNLSSSFPDHSFMDASHYTQQRTAYTASGWVTGVMSGFVVLWWGATCDITYPGDGTTVT